MIRKMMLLAPAVVLLAMFPSPALPAAASSPTIAIGTVRLTGSSATETDTYTVPFTTQRPAGVTVHGHKVELKIHAPNANGQAFTGTGSADVRGLATSASINIFHVFVAETYEVVITTSYTNQLGRSTKTTRATGSF